MTTEKPTKKWFPLESNPEVMNKYIQSLGMSPEAPLQFVDIFGLDDELLSMVHAPAALLLVFPVSAATEKENAEACADVDPKTLDALPSDVKPFYIKQTIANACGTIGILHAILNNLDKLGTYIQPDSFLAHYVKDAENMSGEDRVKLLEGSDKLDEAQAVAAQEGQSEVKELETRIDLHFVAFVNRGGTVYELDGRKPFALPRGQCEKDGSNLLHVSAETVRKYIAISDSDNFSLVALGAPPAW